MTLRDDYVFDDEPEGRTLVVTGRWSDAAGQALVSGAADGLLLNYARGFVGSDLEFLDKHLCVRRFKLLDRGITNLEPIARLSDSLEELSVQASADAELDLSALPHLRAVAGEWALIGETLASLNDLQSVITWRFNEIDLHSFRDHVGLRHLTIKEAPYLESISGVGDLPELERLSIILAQQLTDISDVAGLAESLREFELETCPVIDTVDVVEPLENLHFLGFSECGEIESLAPVGRLEQLTELDAWGTTRILDGDLSPLTKLPHLREVRMRDRAHYRPRVPDLVSSLRAGG